MSIEAAFAGFAAEEDDIIKSSEADTYYYGEEFGWFGDLDTLVPGQGYMYYSTSSEVKTLTFTLSARKGGK